MGFKVVEWKASYAQRVQEKIKEVEEILKPYLKEYDGKSSHHMGSTSITGMIGKPTPDMTVVTEGLLPDIPDEIIRKLDAIGWKYMGPSPHCFDRNADHWFGLICTPEQVKTNDGIMSYTLHVVSHQEAQQSLQQFINFRDYCNQSADARQRYRSIKLSVNANATIMEYSMKKMDTVFKIKDEANEWAEGKKK